MYAVPQEVDYQRRAISGSRVCIVSCKTQVHEARQGPDSTRIFYFFSPRQAQLRVHESTQKLQLLRHSLEKCLQENRQQTLLQPAGPTDVSGDLPSPSGSSHGHPWMPGSPSFPSLRPASLTGNAAPPSSSHNARFLLCTSKPGWEKNAQFEIFFAADLQWFSVASWTLDFSDRL